MAPPADRNEFEIAIVCALHRELDAVELVLDEIWNERDHKYGRAVGDYNFYKTGRIGQFNVVLVLLPNMGKAAAAGTAAGIRSSFPAVKLAFLTGICGGVPFTDRRKEMILGDVVISTTLVQYDFGRQIVDRFELKEKLEESLGRGTKNIRNFINQAQVSSEKKDIQQRAASYLLQIQQKKAAEDEDDGEPDTYNYPGASSDKLFDDDYHHKHRDGKCDTCNRGPAEVCQAASKQTCKNLKCDEQELVPRKRLERKQKLENEDKVAQAQAPLIFVGRMGSGDTVMKSSQDRNTIASENALLAFEMEGAGMFDEIPCIVVKGVCDYADSHKNKGWQDFAAATAASVTKALIDLYPKTDEQAVAKSSNAPAEPSPGPGPSLVPGPSPGSGSAPGGATFYGNISGNNVVSGHTNTGGTNNYTFNK
ncbi:nucleoside phosphorylase domain-containing protein [Thelonectria olida]|uniref:Nucleoside phosphorylase domain-containing protein n=1 Tax=Thelonectria olida TaxID=1576542 RepID=A0A9P8VZI3_9HYPO|nr:nucleoside phosphorylase domain-containing protein [Thelonectria olida]